MKPIENKINEVEAEMKRIGLWQAEPLPESAYDIKEAFGADTMTLAQWIQFILIPEVRRKIASNIPLPELSQVGTYAAQQYLFFRPTDNDPSVFETEGSIDRKESKLVHLLQEFDALINKSVA